jgi:hypothetical protein
MGNVGSGPQRAAAGQRGQAIVFFVLALVVLLGASALVIDVGSWFKAKRDAQATADAAALGAVQDLPSSSFSVALDVGQLRRENNFNGTVTSSLSSTYGAGDTITTEATDTRPSFFAKVFGIGSASVGGRATATIASYTEFGANIMPWAVLPTDVSNPANYVTPFAMKTGGGSKLNAGEYGAIDLNVVNGASCALDTGANPYTDTISGVLQPCGTKVGDVVSTEGGAMSGPTAQGLKARTVNGQQIVNPLDPTTLLTTNPTTGDSELTSVNHPNVILIPVINSWPGGNKPVTIVGLVWFLITSYNGSNVSGIFVHTATAPGTLQCHHANGSTSTCGVGAYDPTGGANSGTRVILLTR